MDRGLDHGARFWDLWFVAPGPLGPGWDDWDWIWHLSLGRGAQKLDRHFDFSDMLFGGLEFGSGFVFIGLGLY